MATMTTVTHDPGPKCNRCQASQPIGAPPYIECYWCRQYYCALCAGSAMTHAAMAAQLSSVSVDADRACELCVRYAAHAYVVKRPMPPSSMRVDTNNYDPNLRETKINFFN